MPCLVRLPDIVCDFLSQRHDKLYYFISGIMDYLLAGKDQQQTNQLNDQAARELLPGYLPKSFSFQTLPFLCYVLCTQFKFWFGLQAF